MSLTRKIFFEDLVCRINKKQCVDVGRVVETDEFSDMGFSSDDDESSDGAIEHNHRMKEGHIRVIWYPHYKQEVLPEEKVTLYDRNVDNCLTVKQVTKEKGTQLGYCRYMTVKSDVLIVGTKQVIVGVDSRDLFPLQEFSRSLIFKDHWVGRVKKVETVLTLRCSDGSRCLMSDIDAFDMVDVLEKKDRVFRMHKYYPGQQFVGDSSCFKNVKWLLLNKALEDDLKSPKKRIHSTLEEIKNVSLAVDWKTIAFCEENLENRSFERPKIKLKDDDLKSVKMIDVFMPSRLQVGHRNHLIMKEKYEVISLHEWKRRLFDRLAAKSHVSKCNQVDDNDANTSPINTKGGSEIEDVGKEKNENSFCASSGASHSVAPSVKANLYSPYYYATKIREKVKSAWRYAMGYDVKERLALTPGVKLVVEALVTETRADVVWQDGSVEQNVLAASLHPHVEYTEFFPGNFVVHNGDLHTSHKYGVVKQVNYNGRTALITWMKTYHDINNPHPEILNEEEVSIYDIQKHPQFIFHVASYVIRLASSKDLNSSSTVGQVVDVHSNGQVLVAWVTGESSLCYPQDLCSFYNITFGVDSDSGDDIMDFEIPEFVFEMDTGASDKEFAVTVKKLKNTLKNVYQERTYPIDEIEEYTEDGMLINKEIERTVEEFEKVFLKQPFQDNSQNDEKAAIDVGTKLLENIEALRTGMTNLEKMLSQNPVQQTFSVIRRLLELFEHCRDLDQLLGTRYFYDEYLQFLVEQVIETLKRRGRIVRTKYSNIQSKEENVNDNEKVLHPSTDGFSSENDKDNTKERPLLPSVSSLFAIDGVPPNPCLQLCTSLKHILLKAHKDAELKFGMPLDEANALLAEETEQNQESIIKDSNGHERLSDTMKEKLSSEKESLDTTKEKVSSEKNQSNSEGNVLCVPSSSEGTFSILESVPDSHKFKLSILQPAQPTVFFRTIKKEIKILKSSLPDGIIVRGYEDRIDLYSVLIKGPKDTPYEDGLFFFDFQFPAEYPNVPPRCHYISYCSEMLNPNLYEEGKVCVSLLGTWEGKGTEVWNPETSNLFQVIVSIQGLILVSEPFFNEPGLDRQRETPEGIENSLAYNEMAVIKLIQAMSKLFVNPPEVFQEIIADHFKTQAFKLVKRLENWIAASEAWNTAHPTRPIELRETYYYSGDHAIGGVKLPEFPLIPASNGFCISLRKSLADFKVLLLSSDINLS